MHWHWRQEVHLPTYCGVAKRKSWHKGNSDRDRNAITLQQTVWLLLGTWFIYSSKLACKTIRKCLMAPPQPEPELAFSPGESFAQNPSQSNSQTMPAECHQGSGPHQEAVTLNVSRCAFVCFFLFFSCSHWDVRLPVTLGGSPCFVSHLAWALWIGSREVWIAATKGLDWDSWEMTQEEG